VIHVPVIYALNANKSIMELWNVKIDRSLKIWDYLIVLSAKEWLKKLVDAIIWHALHANTSGAGCASKSMKAGTMIKRARVNALAKCSRGMKDIRLKRRGKEGSQER